jgi:hypothetical protein
MRSTVQHSSLFVLIVSAALHGCSGGESVDRYIPETQKARASLEAALDAWKSGAPKKTIDAQGYKIDVFDARWRDGAKLESFEIVSEEAGADRPTYVVKTRIKGKDEENKYLIIGIDPILVFRDVDYKKANGL